MSDEIDIEEHDILDNPAIKKIFPDLSIIKKELSEFEEGLSSSVEGSAYERDSPLKVEPTFQQSGQLTSLSPVKYEPENTQQTSGLSHSRFQAFFNSLDDDFEDSDVNTITKLDIGRQNLNSNNCYATSLNSDKPIKHKLKNAKCLGNNILILGSKPSVQHTKKKTTTKRQLKIVLQSIDSYLSKSKRYCRHCFILFPNVSSMTFHISKCHSPKRRDSTTQKNMQSVPKKCNTRFQCALCTITLSSKSNLQRHMQNVHKRKGKKHGSTINTSKRTLKQHTNENNLSVVKVTPSPSKAKSVMESTQSHDCFHCNKIFKDQISLIEHLYNIIDPNKIVSDDSPKSVSPHLSKDKIKDIDDVATKEKNVQKYDKHVEHEVPESMVSDTDLVELSQNSVDITDDTNEYNDNIKEFDKPMSSKVTSDTNKQKNKAESESKTKRQIYRCFVCSQYIITYKWYSYHMRNHSVKETPEEEKATFTAQCKFCSLKPNSIKLYNSHISKVHSEKLTVKLNIRERALQSVVFKCAECNIFFLSTHAAISHSEHQEIFSNWKCLECQRIFKTNDKQLHIQQHTLCKDITTYELPASALERVLFKCLKCTIHFSEDEYCRHHTIGDCEIPDSVYCSTCDALIYKNDMPAHERHHKDQNLQLCDFTFIESDVMVNKVRKTTYNKNIFNNPNFTLTFCHTCKCFLNNLCKTRKTHIKKRCNGINPRMCTKCGLVFTSKGYLSHKMLHDKIESLNMQNYYFIDIKSNELIQPPLPEYPNCNICKVHFLNKRVLKGHECNQQHYIVCNTCKIKLTEAAYKLHINYHNYNLTSVAGHKKQIAKIKLDKPAPSTDNNKSSSAKDSPTVNLISDVVDTNTSVNIHRFYNCIICDFTVDMYDKAIEHCHDHYDYSKRSNTSDHEPNQRCGKNSNKRSIVIKYDPFYIRFPNDVWVKHMFANVTEDFVKDTLEKSVYRFESRFKMELIQPGPNSSVLYKCDMCRSYVYNVSNLYLHVKNSCSMSKKLPCTVCGLRFSFSNCLTDHQKYHLESPEITSYSIILYNKTEHQQFSQTMVLSHDKFVLYQCRNCECIVDRLQRGIHKCRYTEIIKCSKCGLLFCDHEFNLHFNKHQEFSDFKSENITLILFGKVGSQTDNKLKPSFSGTIYDLSYFKCINCGICLKSKSEISKHVCVFKSYKKQCPKCYLCFSKKELQEHYLLHENNFELGYDDFNSNVITFDLSSLKTNTSNEIILDFLALDKDIDNKVTSVNETVNSNTVQTIYKCPCGLHFVDDLSACKHYNNCYPKMKISKQTCFKCDLLFTPGALFDHLLKHHRDKNMRYKYHIINITEEMKIKQ